MIDEINPQCLHCIHREVCKNAEKYREIMIHISNEVGNMPDWLAYRLVCKDFRKTPTIEDLGTLFEKVKEVDGRVVRYTISRQNGMSVLSFLDKDDTCLWSVDLNRITPAEIFKWISDWCKDNSSAIAESFLLLGA